MPETRVGEREGGREQRRGRQPSGAEGRERDGSAHGSSTRKGRSARGPIGVEENRQDQERGEEERREEKREKRRESTAKMTFPFSVNSSAHTRSALGVHGA